ncbi:MAG: hypothetical protein H6Q41_3463 [Deltaproteobacteria bacterium]|jgi:hypothetical protein|nr:hypothetical protein [Deltaproteobacteria bacterium]
MKEKIKEFVLGLGTDDVVCRKPNRRTEKDGERCELLAFIAGWLHRGGTLVPQPNGIPSGPLIPIN